MSHFFKVLSTLTLLVSFELISMGQTAFASTREPQRTIRFEPCSRWRIDASTGLNTCVFVEQQVSVEDAQTTQRLAQIVNELRQEIDLLKRRVNQLENP